MQPEWIADHADEHQRIKQRLCNVEDLQKELNRVMAWMEHTVLAGNSPATRVEHANKLEGFRKEFSDKFGGVVAELNRQASSLRMMEAKQKDTEAGSLRLQKRMSLLEAFCTKSVADQSNSQLQHKKDVDSVKEVISNFLNGIGNMASTLEAGQTLQAMSKKRGLCGNSEGAMYNKKPYLSKGEETERKQKAFLALLSWMSEDRQRTESLFERHISAVTNELYMGFSSGSFSDMAKKWFREAPENDMARVACEVFSNGVNVLRTMQQILGKTCVVTSHESKKVGKPAVYELKVPDAHKFFQEIVTGAIKHPLSPEGPHNEADICSKQM